MYFIFESGGKQHKASPKQRLRVEKLPQAVGKEVLFDKVLMRAGDDKVEYGTPYLQGETIKARVVRQGRTDKIPVIKFKRRKHYIKRRNHRQAYTEVEILRLVSAEGESRSMSRTIESQAGDSFGSPGAAAPTRTTPEESRKDT